MQFKSFSFSSHFRNCTIPYKTAVCPNTHTHKQTPVTSSPSSTEHTKNIWNKNHIDYFFHSICSNVCTLFCFFQLFAEYFSFTCDPQLSITVHGNFINSNTPFVPYFFFAILIIETVYRNGIVCFFFLTWKQEKTYLCFQFLFNQYHFLYY